MAIELEDLKHWVSEAVSDIVKRKKIIENKE
jgi:hypothetical protein